MAKKVTFTYYSSDLIECMLFSSEKDANSFDETLTNFLNNPEAIKEFASVTLASISAIEYRIKAGDLQLLIEGENWDELMDSCENCVELIGDEYNNIYQPMLYYLFNKIFCNYKK